MSTRKAAAASDASATVTYCDKSHSQRVLFLPGGRPLQVLRARLEVKADDDKALAYMDARADFQRLEA